MTPAKVLYVCAYVCWHYTLHVTTTSAVIFPENFARNLRLFLFCFVGSFHTFKRFYDVSFYITHFCSICCSTGLRAVVCYAWTGIKTIVWGECVSNRTVIRLLKRYGKSK